MHFFLVISLLTSPINFFESIGTVFNLPTSKSSAQSELIGPQDVPRTSPKDPI